MLQLSVMGHWEQGHQKNLQLARLWEGTRWKISLDRAASFVVGEAGGVFWRLWICLMSRDVAGGITTETEKEGKGRRLFRPCRWREEHM